MSVFNTYKLMLSCMGKQDINKLNLDELVKSYKESTDKKEKSKLFATIFCKLFPMFNRIQKKFYTLTNEQRVEEGLYQLVKGLDNYNYSTKFITFIVTHWNNKFRSFTTNENSHKRAAFQHIVPNNDVVLQNYKEKPDNTKVAEFEQFNSHLEMSNNLSEEEKEFCQCVLKGYRNTKDLLEQMKTVRKDAVVSNPLFAVDNSVLKQMSDDCAASKLKKIKSSLKKKLDFYGDDIFS